MSLRARIFIIISLAVLLILSVSIFLIISAKKKAALNAQNATTTTENVIDKSNFNSAALQQGATTITPGMPVKQLTALEVEKNAVKQLAKIFAERYGTYSTDSNFQNIKDVQDLVTTNLWSRLKTKITGGPAASFSGATANVITTNLTKWGDTSAEVQLQAVVVKEQNGTQTKISQNVIVSMVKIGGSWLVSDFVWK